MKQNMNRFYCTAIILIAGTVILVAVFQNVSLNLIQNEFQFLPDSLINKSTNKQNETSRLVQEKFGKLSNLVTELSDKLTKIKAAVRNKEGINL